MPSRVQKRSTHEMFGVYIGLYIFLATSTSLAYLGFLHDVRSVGMAILIGAAVASCLLAQLGLRLSSRPATRSTIVALTTLSGIMLAMIPLGISGLLTGIFAVVAGVVWWICYLETVSRTCRRSSDRRRMTAQQTVNFLMTNR